jgi:hypothetical protein
VWQTVLDFIPYATEGSPEANIGNSTRALEYFYQEFGTILFGVVRQLRERQPPQRYTLRLPAARTLHE